MVVDGRYRVVRFLEKGSMGVVVAASHVHLGGEVALKFLSLKRMSDRGFRERFLREGRVTAKLRSRHIVRTSDFGFDGHGRPFLVMELLQGESLRAKLAREGPLPVDLAVEYARQACEGLVEAHRIGVIHRDLKPANLFVTTDVDHSDLVKILDFGLAKMRDLAAEDLTAEGALIGSPRYMAPEQVGSAELVDPRADLWSMGAILYEMLAGSPPFDAQSVPKLIMKVAEGRDYTPLHLRRPDVGEALADIVHRCLTKPLDQRMPSAGQLLADLSSLSARTSQRPERPLHTLDEVRPTAGQPAVRSWIIAVAGLVLVFGGATWLAWGIGRRHAGLPATSHAPPTTSPSTGNRNADPTASSAASLPAASSHRPAPVVVPPPAPARIERGGSSAPARDPFGSRY